MDCSSKDWIVSDRFDMLDLEHADFPAWLPDRLRAPERISDGWLVVRDGGCVGGISMWAWSTPLYTRFTPDLRPNHHFYACGGSLSGHRRCVNQV
jgi:hypothetical protein